MKQAAIGKTAPLNRNICCLPCWEQDSGLTDTDFITKASGLTRAGYPEQGPREAAINGFPRASGATAHKGVSISCGTEPYPCPLPPRMRSGRHEGQLRRHRAPPGLTGRRQGEPKQGESLPKTGYLRDALLAALKEVRGDERVTDQNPEERYQALAKYARDLTDLARKGNRTRSSAGTKKSDG